MRIALLSAAVLLPLASLGAQDTARARAGQAQDTTRARAGQQRDTALVARAMARPTAASAKAIVVMADAVNWGAGPAALPPGASAAVLEGDPTKSGVFTMRLRFPDGYKIAPHHHPAMEHITVISGTFMVGMGDTFDEGQMKTLTAGSFGAVPPGMHHYAMAQGETVIQLHGVGPWRLIYLNKADDPRTKSKPVGP
jgi:quercetin dioxygenase-like cupin family protein